MQYAGLFFKKRIQGRKTFLPYSGVTLFSSMNYIYNAIFTETIGQIRHFLPGKCSSRIGLMRRGAMSYSKHLRRHSQFWFNI